MTVDLFSGPVGYTVSGTGPYNVPWEYTEGALVITIEDDAGDVILTDTDFSVDPESGETGDVTVISSIATTYDGLRLVIERDTTAEQGWAGLEAREKGVEAQLDRNVMALQENKAAIAQTLRTRSGDVAPLPGTATDRAARSVIFSATGEALEAGPTADEIENAQGYSEAASDAADRAELAAGFTDLYPRMYQDVATMLTSIDDYTDEINVVGAHVRAGPHEYEIVASDAEGAHVEAASGLKLNLVAENNLVVAFSSTGAIDDGSTLIDNSLAFNTLTEWLAGQGGGKLVIDAAAGGAGYYMNGNMKIPGGVHVDFQTPVIYGPDARMAVQGKIVEEQDTLGDGSYFLIRETSGAGETYPDRLYISNASGATAAEFSAGDMIVIRGENDANGIAINSETVFVSSVVSGSGADLTTNYLVLDRDLTNAYEPEYPASEQPEGTDRTTVGRVVASKMAADAAYGDTAVLVADSAAFTVGDWVHLQDEETVDKFDTGTDTIVTTSNQTNLQMNQITAIDGGTDTLTLTTPLRHSFATAENAVVIKAAPVIGARISNMQVTFSDAATELNRWVIWLNFAVACQVDNFRIITVPGAAAGHATHGVRIGEGCLGNTVTGGKVLRATNTDGGFGYGVTLYKGAEGNVVTANFFDGMRHAVLEFMGASNNIISNNVSHNCYNSDFDAHNGGESGSHYIGNTARYGPDIADDTTIKSGFRIGNPAHLKGSRGITMTGNVVEGFPAGHFGFDVQPPCVNAVLTGNRAVDCAAMFRVKYNNRGDALADPVKSTMQALAISGLTIANNHMMNGERMIDLDGGPARSVSGVVGKGNVVQNATNNQIQFYVQRADEVALLDEVSLGTTAGTATDLMRFEDVTNLKVLGLTVNGANKVMRLEDCPDAIIDGLRASGVTGQILVDEGGNDNFRFTDYRSFGFTPAILDNAVSSGRVIRAHALDNPALYSLGDLTPAADRLPYYSSATGAALAPLTSFARSILDDVDEDAARTTLGVGSSFTDVTIADDAVAAITAPANGGFLTLVINRLGYPNTALNAILYYDCGASSAIGIVYASSDIDAFHNLNLTGTAGVDGHLTVSTELGDGTIQIENRTGNSRDVRVNWI